MLQGALAAARKAKAAVGSAVTDLLDTADELDVDLSDEDLDEDLTLDEAELLGDDDEDDGGIDGSNGSAPSPGGGALAALRARLAAERERRASSQRAELDKQADPESGGASHDARFIPPVESASRRREDDQHARPATPVSHGSTTPEQPGRMSTNVRIAPQTRAAPPTAAASPAAVSSSVDGSHGSLSSLGPPSPPGMPYGAVVAALEKERAALHARLEEESRRAAALEAEAETMRRRADAHAAETAEAVAAAVEREQLKAAAMMDAMAEGGGSIPTGGADPVEVAALRREVEKLHVTRRSLEDAAARASDSAAAAQKEARDVEERLGRALEEAEAKARAAEARAAEAEAGATGASEGGRGGSEVELRLKMRLSEAEHRLLEQSEELEELERRHRTEVVGAANALATAEAKAETLQRELDVTTAESERREKELERLRRHLLDMEDEDDDKAASAESRLEAIRIEQEEEHQAALAVKEAAARAAERELEVMHEAMQARDAELANLQLALECFNSEVETGERRAAETVALREKNATLMAELVVERERLSAAGKKAEEAEARCTAAERAAAAAQADAAKAVGESTRARQALHQSMKQAKHMMSETSSLLDKRIVAKLLLTYFERDQSKDVLELMTRMLNFSPAEKEKVGLGSGGRGGKRGMLRTVAAAPANLVFGALGLAGAVAGSVLDMPVHAAEALKTAEEDNTIADQWVEFLLTQMDQDDDDLPPLSPGPSPGGRGGSGGGGGGEGLTRGGGSGRGPGAASPSSPAAVAQTPVPPPTSIPSVPPSAPDFAAVPTVSPAVVPSSLPLPPAPAAASSAPPVLETSVVTVAGPIPFK